MSFRAIAVAFAFGVVVSACDSTEPVRAAPVTTPVGPQVIALTNPQSAAVLNSINDAQLRVTNAVMVRLTDPDVWAYGQLIITQHADLERQLTVLEMQQGITPQANAVSQAVDQAAQQTINQLTALTGDAINGAYLNSEIVMHQQSLALIDCVLLPTGLNASIAGFLTGAMRPEEAAHLTQASSLAVMLNGAAASVTTGAADCSLACTAGGLLTEPLRTASCTAQ